MMCWCCSQTATQQTTACGQLEARAQGSVGTSECLLMVQAGCLPCMLSLLVQLLWHCCHHLLVLQPADGCCAAGDTCV